LLNGLGEVPQRDGKNSRIDRDILTFEVSSKINALE
jgi:hypothetical protein